MVLGNFLLLLLSSINPDLDLQPTVLIQYDLIYCNLTPIVDNRAVHLPGEHPAAGGEDLRPRGDGVGDVAPFLTIASVWSGHPGCG